MVLPDIQEYLKLIPAVGLKQRSRESFIDCSSPDAHQARRTEDNAGYEISSWYTQGNNKGFVSGFL